MRGVVATEHDFRRVNYACQLFTYNFERRIGCSEPTSSSQPVVGFLLLIDMVEKTLTSFRRLGGAYGYLAGKGTLD